MHKVRFVASVLALCGGVVPLSRAATGYEARVGAESSLASSAPCGDRSTGAADAGAWAEMMSCATMPVDTTFYGWAQGLQGDTGPDLHARARMQYTNETLKSVGGAVRFSAGAGATYLDRLQGVLGGLSPAVVRFSTHLDGTTLIAGYLQGSGSNLVAARGINQLSLVDEASGTVLEVARAVVTSQGASFVQSLLGGQLQAQINASATGGWDIGFTWNTLGWTGAPVIVRMELNAVVVADGTTAAGALPVPPMPFWLGGYFAGEADFGNTLHWTALSAWDATGQDVTAQALRLDGALFGIEAPAPVPEPGRAALWAAGLSILAWTAAARRRGPPRSGS